MSKISILVFAALVAGTAAAADLNDLVERHYLSIRTTAVPIFNFPADKFFFVFVGRSPTPIVAFLQELGMPNMATVALSNLKFTSSHEINRTKLFAHFDRSLPMLKAMRGKTILLTDFVASGRSLPVELELMQEYVNARKLDVSIEPFALKGRRGAGDYYPGVRVENELAESLRDEQWEYFSEIGGFDPSGGYLFDARPAEYSSLREKLKSKMQEDKELDEVLSLIRDPSPTESCEGNVVVQKPKRKRARS